jgi:two-component system CitB family sensor kinase
VVNESATELLSLPDAAAGSPVAELDIGVEVKRVLLDPSDTQDSLLLVGERLVVLNRNRVTHGNRQVGTVTTLRDRTELIAMQSQLDAHQSITETLRAQTHEFANQLHTISGLVELEEYGEVSALIGNLTRRRAEIADAITGVVEDPTVAALLIAKISLAAEAGVTIELTQDSGLVRADRELSTDVATVLGNLIDNAIDASSGAARRTVRIRVVDESAAVVLEVADSGGGVPSDMTDAIFRRGFSTKPSVLGGRGVGLALVHLVCTRRGGTVTVHNDGGAVFRATLPYAKVLHDQRAHR